MVDRTTTPSVSTPAACATAGVDATTAACGRAAHASWRLRRVWRRSTCSTTGGCSLRSTSSSVAPSATRRLVPVSRRACRLTDDDERARVWEIAEQRLGGSARRRSRRPRSSAVHGTARGRHRRPSRRHGAAVQRGRRAVLRRGFDQGGVRDGNARRRCEHAGPERRHREAHQVHRRPPRVAVTRPVHTAHRARRPTRHRRARFGDRALESVRSIRAGCRPRAEPENGFACWRSSRLDISRSSAAMAPLSGWASITARTPGHPD